MKIVCAILGGGADSNLRNPFTVQMDQNATVASLISKLNVGLARFEGADLPLYKVNLPITADTYDTVIESITQRTIELDESTKPKYPFLKLSDMNGGIPDGHIHILVDPPAGEAPIQLVEIVLSLTRRSPIAIYAVVATATIRSPITPLPNDDAPRLTPYYHSLIDVNAIHPSPMT